MYRYISPKSCHHHRHIRHRPHPHQHRHLIVIIINISLSNSRSNYAAVSASSRLCSASLSPSPPPSSTWTDYRLSSSWRFIINGDSLVIHHHCPPNYLHCHPYEQINHNYFHQGTHHNNCDHFQTLRECVYQSSSRTCTCFAGIMDHRSIDYEATLRFLSSTMRQHYQLSTLTLSTMRQHSWFSVIKVSSLLSSWLKLAPS